MSRLPRPYIPVSVRIKVAEDQLRRRINDPSVLPLLSRTLQPRSRYLVWLLGQLFKEEPCDLDHDPPLAARKKIKRDGIVVGYKPDANDPQYLVYRLVDDHRVKTNVRGEHGQYSDRALIKRERRRERPRKKKMPWLRKIAGKPVSVFKAAVGKPRKFKWPSRPFPTKRKSK